MTLTLRAVCAGEDAVMFYLPEPVAKNYPVVLANLAKQAKKLGAIDVVPAYHSLLVTFNRRDHCADDFHVALNAYLADNEHKNWRVTRAKTIRIPVCYEGDFAPDLASVSKQHGLSETAVIERHLANCYRVCCLGFIPGFAFLGYVDDSIATPRHTNPRPLVAGGSVGIAGKQTGVYPTDSPGGWNIIGRTPQRLYAPEKGLISCFGLGDRVQFYRISADEFKVWENK
ncbi:MAG: hypothetical protein CSA47_01720 [Gammaproteobacteria bacterium]|nr:MAG: hypothetical protein CSA47_01720 [Gammaproteobacteria bacterium]